MLEESRITDVTANRNVVRLIIHKLPDHPGGFAELFGILAHAGINMRLICQSRNGGRWTDIAMLISEGYLNRALTALQRVKRQLRWEDLWWEDNIVEVSIKGYGLLTAQDVPLRLFRALAAREINIELISMSPTRISCVVNKRHGREAVRAVRDAFKLK